MQRAEKTLAVSGESEIPGVLVVVVTGLAVLVGSTGWEVAWLIALAVAAVLRHYGERLATTVRPPGVPQEPGDGGSPGR